MKREDIKPGMVLRHALVCGFDSEYLEVQCIYLPNPGEPTYARVRDITNTVYIVKLDELTI